jgi:hypothetical protein
MLFAGGEDISVITYFSSSNVAAALDSGRSDLVSSTLTSVAGLMGISPEDSTCKRNKYR